MEFFNKEFVMEMFLDSESVSTTNRLVVAMVNVMKENNENISIFNQILLKEYDRGMVCDEQKVDSFPKPCKIKNFYENVVPNYSDEEYSNKFKMKRSTAQALISYLQDNKYVKPAVSIVPFDKKLHVFLWLMTTDSSFSEVGSIFNLHKSSVSYIFHEMALLLTELKFKFVSWPSMEKQHLISVKVNSRFNFPNCVGFIDACPFKVGKKKKPGHSDTVLLQGVCDDSLFFFDIHVGEIGQTRKSRVYKGSKLSKKLNQLISFENHILGDSEYKLRKNLITPFTSEEILTSEEMKFNEIHWRACAFIGHAFGMLKERFRRLYHLGVIKVDAVEIILIAACVLHNFILLHEGSPEVKEEFVSCDDSVSIDTDIVKTADEKRQFLCNYINHINET